MRNHSVAVIYQFLDPPEINGIYKPKKMNGYKDSGADIAYALSNSGISVITPVTNPNPVKDEDWVFPDSEAGIDRAIELGANVIWANTILFDSHPVNRLSDSGIHLIGQNASLVNRFDDKWYARNYIHDHSLPVPHALLINGLCSTSELGHSINLLNTELLSRNNLSFPLVTKPVRGRGSEAVCVADDIEELLENINFMHSATTEQGQPRYGYSTIVEDFLEGDEVTITVMPPGTYKLNGVGTLMGDYWCLPPVARFAHQKGIAPYNGIVAVVNNSYAIDVQTEQMCLITKHCASAARAIKSNAPIRIDCRADKDGNYKMFDINMKPNMTGPGRPGRQMQSSLTQIAASHMGWNYENYLLAVFETALNQNEEI